MNDLTIIVSPSLNRDGRPFRFNRHQYRWCGDELIIGSRVVAKVVPDATCSGMWRVDLGDGRLSDMVNLSRAKDAAVALADAFIESGRQTPRRPPYVRSPEVAGRVVAAA